MADEMTEERLRETRECILAAANAGEPEPRAEELLAEVDRLRAELAGLISELPLCDHNDGARCNRPATYQNGDLGACDEHAPRSPDWLALDWAPYVRQEGTR